LRPYERAQTTEVGKPHTAKINDHAGKAAPEQYGQTTLQRRLGGQIKLTV
jgi:hypothetical protein